MKDKHIGFLIQDTAFEPWAKQGEYIVCETDKLPPGSKGNWSVAEIMHAAIWIYRPVGPNPYTHKGTA